MKRVALHTVCNTTWKNEKKKKRDLFLQSEAGEGCSAASPAAAADAPSSRAQAGSIILWCYSP